MTPAKKKYAECRKKYRERRKEDRTADAECKKASSIKLKTAPYSIQQPMKNFKKATSFGKLNPNFMRIQILTLVN